MEDLVGVAEVTGQGMRHFVQCAIKTLMNGKMRVR